MTWTFWFGIGMALLSAYIAGYCHGAGALRRE